MPVFATRLAWFLNFRISKAAEAFQLTRSFASYYAAVKDKMELVKSKKDRNHSVQALWVFLKSKTHVLAILDDKLYMDTL